MTEENKELSLDQVLGINFNKDGTWSAKDIGKTPIYRKMNRKERRLAEKRDRKLLKRFNRVNDDQA